MPIFGRYEVVEQLHAGPAGSVSRAKLVDGRGAHFVVKVAQFDEADGESLRQHVEDFLDRARTQRQAAAAADTHWARIYHSAKIPGGAFYVTDLFAGSLQARIDDPTPLDERELAHVVGSIVDGLRELRAVCGRAHGNLKPSNVLLSSHHLPSAKLALADPAPKAAVSQVGEAGDLRALGEIMFALIERRRPVGDIDLSVPSTVAWRRLGPQGEGWRQLCADLLLPQQPGSEGHLDELAGLVGKLSSLAQPGERKWPRRVAIVVLAVLAVCSVFSCRTQRELSRARSQWLDALAATIADPARVARYRADPSLRNVMSDVATADDPSVSCTPGLANLSPWHDARMRECLSAARHVETDLSPDHWPVASRLLDMQHVFEAQGWSQPAGFIAARLDSARPGPDTNLDATIQQLQALDAQSQQLLPALQRDWSTLDQRTTDLSKFPDGYISALATGLRRSAQTAIQLSPGGLSGADVLHGDADMADQLQAAVRNGYPTQIDVQRFSADVTSRLDLGHITAADVRRWLDREPLYKVEDGQTAQAVGELRGSLQRNLAQIAQIHPDADEQREINSQRRSIEQDLDTFAAARFITKDLTDGTFMGRRAKIDSQIDELLDHIRRADPAPWIRSLPTLATRSDVINAYWEDWKHVLQTSADEMARRNDLFATYRRQTKALQTGLTGLDADFPAVPSGLSAPFAAAAQNRRERNLGGLLAAITPGNTPISFPGQQAAADAYRQWCGHLVRLGQSFPIHSELLTLSDQPDQPWIHDNPDFWNDRAVQELVAADVTRLAKLRAVQKLGRADLIDAASESVVPEITFAAWQQLGNPSLSPAWPTQPGELETERDLRGKLATMAGTLTQAQPRALMATALADQGVVRWQRFVQSARSEVMLQRGIELQNVFGQDTDLIAGLSSAARFNVALYLGRQQTSQLNDQGAAQIIAALNRSAGELPDQKPVQRLLDRLARIQVKETFTGRNPGDQFTLDIPGARPPFVFQRVEPPDDRPFYLCTTAVSFGQFAGVIQAAGGWQQAAAFAWGAEPGERDKRRGPRVWEWTQKPALQMVNPLLWLYPDDDNDYAPPFRIDRFNRTAVSDDVGGNPSPDHPMQQIPAEAALYFAGVCGCRLPTASEWRDAYAIFERTVPPERWNLRDQTWEKQRAYAAASNSPTVRWPDEGIFLPEQVTVATGPDAKARPENDGSLFFRPVGAAGGGTFHQLIGNVAQLLCEAPDAFDDWKDKTTPAGIRDFLSRWSDSMFVIGGSALSPPDVPLQTPLPLAHTDVGYSDVGLRLAFTAPARSLGERLTWVLSGQRYLWESTAATTRPAGP
jgi:formylglycine-generating enzyme required for sulfatase activity